MRNVLCLSCHRESVCLPSSIDFGGGVSAAMNSAAVFHNRTLQKLLHRKHRPRREKT